MRYFYDKQGRYLGGSNHEPAPKKAAGSTDVAPESADQVWDEKAEQWVTPQPAAKAAPKKSTRRKSTSRRKSTAKKAAAK